MPEENLDDEVEEALEERECEDDKTCEAKEPSRRRLNALKAILKKLLVADDISGDVKETHVSNLWRKSVDKLTDSEMQTIIHLANCLRPYAPRSSAPCIPATTIKFVILANQLLRDMSGCQRSCHICIASRCRRCL